MVWVMAALDPKRLLRELRQSIERGDSDYPLQITFPPTQLQELGLILDSAEAYEASEKAMSERMALLDARIGELLELLRYDGKTAGGGVVFTGETVDGYRERTGRRKS